MGLELAENSVNKPLSTLSFYYGWLLVSFSGSSLAIDSQQKTRGRNAFLLRDYGQ